ncbi:hypothetical protein DINM_005298 [Dirofilaria immitis]|nr:hypothetical protein [Dirofilaria immitis]
MPKKVTKLVNANNNLQQNLMGQHNLSYTTPAQSRSNNEMIIQSDVRQHRKYDMQYRIVTSAITNKELASISNSEPSSYIMRCHIATTVDSQTILFRIISSHIPDQEYLHLGQ